MIGWYSSSKTVSKKFSEVVYLDLNFTCLTIKFKSCHHASEHDHSVEDDEKGFFTRLNLSHGGIAMPR